MTTTYETDYDEVRNALSYLDPNDRETWWKVGAALKSEFDEGGRSLWEDWSRNYPKWNERESNAQWKSFKYGHIHIGTLFHMAKANGFTFSQNYRAPSAEEIAHREAAWAVKREVQDAWDKVSRDHAARTANIVWENANTRPADAGFPYLSDKGITDPAVLANARINRFKDEDRLVIPMYDRPNHIVNRQAIDANGGKFFLPGGEVGGAYGKIAAPNSDWTGGVYLAEGFATAASIHMATGKPVVIAFNAGNLPKVAAKMAQILPKNAPVYIAADNDASQTGIKKAAEAAQVLGNRARVVMPEFGADDIVRFQAKHGQDALPSDFNDLHELRGLDAVQSALNRPLAPETLPETAVGHEEVREHNNAQAIAGLEPAEAQQLFEAELGKINNVKIRDSVKRELASRDVGFRLPERQKQPVPVETALPGQSPGLNEGPDTPFTRAVDDVVSGNVSAGYIALGTTPDVLQMLGVPQGKVRISGGTIEKAMAKYIGRPHNYDQNDHWVRPGDLKQLQSQMNDPIAIFQSATNAHSLVVLTELYEYEDNKEKPMIAALHINKGKGKHGADLINVSSVYGRSDMQLVRAFDTDLLYANEKKVQDFLTTHPLQLHWDITSSSELSMRNIKTEMDLVQWQNAQKQPIQPNPQQSVPREPVRRDGLGQPEKQPAPEKSAVHSERAPWNDFPPLIRNGTLEELKNSENYQAAKAGDSKAALSLVQSLLNEQTIAEIQEMAGGRKPVIVAVRAEESAGRNKIPFMMARALSSQTGWQVDTKLFQANFAGRTGTDAVYRLANPPIFRGDVQAGRDYLIVDDNSTMGGTIASLRGYIENRGGHVIGAAVMSARETGLDIVPTQKQLDDIQRKHGDAPNDYWTNTFGYGIDHLTRGEAGTIRTSPSFDRLRSGINAARLQRSERMGDRGIAQKSVDTVQSPEPKHLNHNPRTADDKPLSAVSFAQKENIMTDLSPEQIRSYAQRIANITDEADRNAAIDEFAENHGTNIRRQVGEILQEREARVVSGQNENLTDPQPDTTHTAAEQAAVSVSGSPEPQATKDQIADTQPESAAETAPDEENGIEFDGEAQDLEQEAPEAESTFRQPENPAPERETITAEEVRQNLARARAAEALERQDGQKQPVPERQPETVPQQQETRPQTAPEADLGSLFDEAAPQPASEPAPSENPSVPQKPKPVLDLDYETASGLNQRYIRMEGKYLDLNNRTTVMFEDQGGKIKTAAADPQVIRDMLDTAQAKNWGSIKISGSREFKQAMWLEAELRGIPSTGYKPGREDLALRDQLLAERQRNGIEEMQPQQAKQPENSSVQSSSAEPHSQDRKVQAAESQKGVMLLEHGAAPYLHNPDNRTNYFVKYEQDGETRERWGVELESALTESGAQAGDRIEIHDLGRQPVVVNILVRDESGKIVRDEQGNKVFEEKEVEKNLFRIEVLERQQDRQPENVRVRQNGPLPDQSALVHSEAAQAAAKADTSKEKVLAAEIQHRAAQFANGQQRPTGQAAATPNHALESARALYQQQLGKSRKEVKATVQYLENIQRKMTETLEPALRDRQMQRFYESVTADMKSGNIPTPKRTAGQNQTHRNETRHPAHEQENEQEM